MLEVLSQRCCRIQHLPGLLVCKRGGCCRCCLGWWRPAQAACTCLLPPSRGDAEPAHDGSAAEAQADQVAARQEAGDQRPTLLPPLLPGTGLLWGLSCHRRQLLCCDIEEGVAGCSPRGEEQKEEHEAAAAVCCGCVFASYLGASCLQRHMIKNSRLDRAVCLTEVGRDQRFKQITSLSAWSAVQAVSLPQQDKRLDQSVSLHTCSLWGAVSCRPFPLSAPTTASAVLRGVASAACPDHSCNHSSLQGDSTSSQHVHMLAYGLGT